MTFSWNNGNVDAGLKLGRCVDVVYVTVTIVAHFPKESASRLLDTKHAKSGDRFAR